MATDNTPPRLKLIVTIAVITVITLVGIDFVTKSYFAMMTDHALHEKLAPTKDKNTQAEAEKAAFASAALPLDQAMAQLAKGRPEGITPQASDDLGPMTGWSKLPKPAPAAHPHTEPTAAAADAGAAPAAAGDAGAAPAVAGDAGAKPAPHHPAGDAGAHH